MNLCYCINSCSDKGVRPLKSSFRKIYRYSTCAWLSISLVCTWKYVLSLLFKKSVYVCNSVCTFNKGINISFNWCWAMFEPYFTLTHTDTHTYRGHNIWQWTYVRLICRIHTNVLAGYLHWHGEVLHGPLFSPCVLKEGTSNITHTTVKS